MALSSTLRQEIAELKKGARRERAEAKERGDIKMEDGKSALTFELYRFAAGAILQESNPSSVFVHFFLLLSWNLMTRASNTAAVRAGHLRWEEDALMVGISRQKNDQGAARMNPKHCYANPKDPSICLILSMAVYFCVTSVPEAEVDPVLEGSRQQDRFIQGIQSLIESNEAVKTLFGEHGITADDIAAHSTRKGGRSYVSGGTTHGPSYSSIMIRGGWALEGIDNTYVKWSGAGDQFCGRILSGLSVMDESIAMLPPHFLLVDEEVKDAVSACFPRALPAMLTILTMCFASLVYHRDWIRQTLPANHSLFNSVAFSQGLVDKFDGRVKCHWGTDEKMVVTGAPPFAHIAAVTKENNELLKAMPQSFEQAVANQLEKNAFETGTVTRSVLEGLVQSLGAEIMGKLRGGVQGIAEADQEEPPPMRFRLWSVGGIMRRVPSDFQIPTKATAQTLFQLWCMGNIEMQIGLYKNFEVIDFTNRKSQKRLSDMSALMSPVVGWLREHNQWIDEPTPAQVDAMWVTAKAVIDISRVSQRGRKRRLRELAWTTHLNNYRKLQQMSQDEPDGSSSDAEGEGSEDEDEM